MNQSRLAAAIERLCQALRDRTCVAPDCEHLGQVCDSAGCDNRICKLHEHYCPGCEQRYCEDCFEAHQDACDGPARDVYDESVEQTLSAEGDLALGNVDGMCSEDLEVGDQDLKYGSGSELDDPATAQKRGRR